MKVLILGSRRDGPFHGPCRVVNQDPADTNLKPSKATAFQRMHPISDLVAQFGVIIEFTVKTSRTEAFLTSLKSFRILEAA